MLWHFSPIDKISNNSKTCIEFISLSECFKQCRSHSILCLDFYKLSVAGALLESQSRDWGRVILLLISHIVPSSRSGTRTDIYKLKKCIEIEEIF